MSQDPNLSRDPGYHAARADEERKLADSTSDANARAAHLEMAKKYASLAEAEAEQVKERPQQVG
jgi:hypothetical protein